MKKIILIVLCLMFSVMSANASTTYVRYNRAGVPVSVARGWGAPMSVSRAQAMYGQRYRYGYPRPYGYQGMRYNNYPRTSGCGRNNKYQPTVVVPTPVAAASTVSRLSKDYTIRQQKSYVSNGVRYYN